MNINHEPVNQYYDLIPERSAVFNQRIFMEAVMQHANTMGLNGQRIIAISNLKGPNISYRLEYELLEAGELQDYIDTNDALNDAMGPLGQG